MKNIAYHSFICSLYFLLHGCSNSQPQQPLQHQSNKTIAKSTTIPTQKNPQQTLASFDKISCDDIQNPQFQQAVLNAINEIRNHSQQCGKIAYSATHSLKWNNQLQMSSTAHAQDISQRQILSHVGRGGENLATGQTNLKQVLENWLALSPGHCDNLMKPQFKDYAIACSRNPTTHRTYWVQHFGSGKN